MNIIAKMVCESAKKNDWGGEEVQLRAVYADENGEPNEENKSFSNATPSASVQLTITNKNAQGAFQQGKAYYVRFEPAN
jgi:hypothetical protein